MNEKKHSYKLRRLGFCGADDSIHPNLLKTISIHFPFVEWGVLFRPDKEGSPRYATSSWVEQLSAVAKQSSTAATTPIMRLAAHLCGTRVNQLLSGDDSFVVQIKRWGFQRCQINATAINGVDTSRLGESVNVVVGLMKKHDDLEFIIQRNEETKALWEGLLSYFDEEGLPSNISMLFDESKGAGKRLSTSTYSSPTGEYRVGYAGGIGPENVQNVLNEIGAAIDNDSNVGAVNEEVWIDMESSLRTKVLKEDGSVDDVFDLNKCYKCIDVVCRMGFHPFHTGFL